MKEIDLQANREKNNSFDFIASKISLEAHFNDAKKFAIVG